MSQREPKLVWVRWLDSEEVTGWRDATDYAADVTTLPTADCESSGWLIEDTPEVVSVAGSRCVRIDSYVQVMRIPRRCVLEIIEIEG